MSHELARIAARLFNAPLLLTPDQAETIAANLADRFGAEPIKAPTIVARSSGSFSDDDELYEVIDGVAVVRVHGELVNRGSWIRSFSGLTSYEALGDALRRAETDSSLRGVLLDIDSPGGEASGAMETADIVRAVSAKRTVKAFVNSTAASAAYAIAAGAPEIIVTPSAIVGSIGVVYLHLDRSAAYAKNGVKPTLIHAGAYKVDGNSIQPLEPEARARIQATIDGVYDLFVNSIAKHRPDLGAKGARETEAGIFMGQRAIDAGLADRIGAFQSTLKSFPRSPSFAFARAKHGGPAMEPIFTQAAYDAGIANAVSAARAEWSAAQAAAVSEAAAAATKAGAEAERTRIKAILGADAAKGKATLALHFAMSTDMSPEAASAALSAAAAETPAPAAPSGRMGSVPKPAVKGAGDEPATEAKTQAAVDSMWAGAAKKLNASLPKGFRPN